MFRDSILVNLQHDYVLKKLNFVLLTLRSGWAGGGGLRAKNATMLLYFESIYFDMQYDHVMKKLNFDLLTLRSDGGCGAAGKIFATMLPYLLITFN